MGLLSLIAERLPKIMYSSSCSCSVHQALQTTHDRQQELAGGHAEFLHTTDRRLDQRNHVHTANDNVLNDFVKGSGWWNGYCQWVNPVVPWRTQDDEVNKQSYHQANNCKDN
jgi:hypothetical protein